MGAGAAEIFPGTGGGFDLAEATEEIAARSPLQLFWRRLRKDRVALVSLGFVVFLVFVALAAPLIVKILGLPGPYVQNLNLTDEFGSPLGPSGAHPFGVDQLGHDVMSRVIYGTRVSLEVGIVGTAIATVIGVSLGLSPASTAAGWTRCCRAPSTSCCRSPCCCWAWGSAPPAPCAAASAARSQPGTSVIIFLIALVNWTYILRIVRGLVLSLREREFVDAARTLGASDVRIMFREILPNLVAPVIVYATLLIPLNILLEASLSFLGVGVRPPTASWGQMISAATPIFNTAWWYMTFPGVALLLTVLAFNLLGDGLRDALNPRTAR